MHIWPEWFFIALKVGILVLLFGVVERLLALIAGKVWF